MTVRRYTDSLNREWSVSVDTWVFQQVKEQLDFDLTKLLRDELKYLQMLHEELDLLMAILWICCEDQAQADSVTKRDFARGLVGKSIADGLYALVESTSFFYPNPKEGETLRKTMEAMRNYHERLWELVTPQVEEAIRAIPHPTLSDIATSSPDKSESAPKDLRSAS